MEEDDEAAKFLSLAGDHVCSREGFRTGYCAECADLFESEGLCQHGSYPDQCGSCLPFHVGERVCANDHGEWKLGTVVSFDEADNGWFDVAVDEGRQEWYETHEIVSAAITGNFS